MLWICDMALCTYVRCSHDSKSSPHPPSAICLERRNLQAWSTSWHAALQGWGRESDRAHPCFPAANRSYALPCPRPGLPWEFQAQAVSALLISQAQDLGGAVRGAGDPTRSQGIHSSPPQRQAGAGEPDSPFSPVLIYVLHTGECLQTKPGAIGETNPPAPRRKGKAVLSGVPGPR